MGGDQFHYRRQPVLPLEQPIGRFPSVGTPVLASRSLNLQQFTNLRRIRFTNPLGSPFGLRFDVGRSMFDVRCSPPREATCPSKPRRSWKPFTRPFSLWPFLPRRNLMKAGAFSLGNSCSQIRITLHAQHLRGTSRNDQHLDLTFQPLAEAFLYHLQIVMRLQVQPELPGNLEVAAQP
jgi:hypothetical protein